MIESQKSKKILVKGYMRPDGTSYSVNIPKEIREFLSLEGGEHFVIRAKIKSEKKKIGLKLVDLAEE